MEQKNIVIGIEGKVGAGKTSICKNLLNKIDNSIIIHGGNIYRAIVYGMMKEKEKMAKLEAKMDSKPNKEKTPHIGEMGANLENISDLDAFDIMKKLGIEIKLENRETVIYMNGKKVEEEDLQSKQSSMAVSQISNVANNDKLYKFGKDLINKFRKDYNIILSSRDIIKMYPDVTYHFLIDASLEERTKRKYMQYNKEIPIEQIREMIKERDELQEKSGYYKIYPQTKVIDVTDCKSIEVSTQKVLENMKKFASEL